MNKSINQLIEDCNFSRFRQNTLYNSIQRATSAENTEMV